ncbi:hypothetical protein HDV62DRAFT_160012 [Trichoderma sp. SZMC 28011]
MHFIQRQDNKTKVDTSQLLICSSAAKPAPALPAHHRRISAHDGDWRCRCRNPKRIKPLTLLLLKKPFQRDWTPRKPAPAGPATGCPESGHCSPPEWARRRAEESWGFGWGFFFLHKVCCVRCSMENLCIHFSVSCLSSLAFCWTSNNAARVWVLEERLDEV